MTCCIIIIIGVAGHSSGMNSAVTNAPVRSTMLRLQ